MKPIVRHEITFFYFTARRYANVVCVRPSVCLSYTEVGVLPKRQNIVSRKQRRTIAQGSNSNFSDAKDFGEIPMRSPPSVAPNTVQFVKIDGF